MYRFLIKILNKITRSGSEPSPTDIQVETYISVEEGFTYRHVGFILYISRWRLPEGFTYRYVGFILYISRWRLPCYLGRTSGNTAFTKHRFGGPGAKFKLMKTLDLGQITNGIRRPLAAGKGFASMKTLGPTRKISFSDREFFGPDKHMKTMDLGGPRGQISI